MAILITGGAGYIGAHTCIELLQAGLEIVVVDNFSNSKPEALQRITAISKREFPFYQLDILDREALIKVFQENSIEAVIHFAALKAVGESVQKPLAYYRNNLVGTINLCQVMAEFSCKRIVFSSSATVYGLPESLPLTEMSAVGATNPYGWTKLMNEQILTDLQASDPEWSVMLLRYFNPIGAHESGLIGEDPNGIPNNLLPFIAQVAVGKLAKLNIFGNDYATPDGTGVRDYIHVVDLAKGHLKALEKSAESGGVHIYNLGTGVGYSVLEIVKAFEKASGKKVSYQFQPRRLGDIAASYADPTKAWEELGWKAVKGINEMCEDTWRWQEKNPNGLI
ncbi:MAG: UDP-glucose 4-epimerase GalE [Clostridia bacterium]